MTRSARNGCIEPRPAACEEEEEKPNDQQTLSSEKQCGTKSGRNRVTDDRSGTGNSNVCTSSR